MARPKANNNPFALIDETPSPWKGLKGKASDGFLIFDSPINGVRAGFINLANAYLKRGLDTIEKIFPVYAPAGHGDNIPENYITNVVKLTGIPRNKKITTQHEIYKIGKAIVTHEEGKFWMTVKDFDEGFKAALSSSSLLNTLKMSTGIFALLIIGFSLYYLNR